jgi:DNA mismatch endonuclease (patch repair protein)
MADMFTTEKRSEIMSRIKSKNSKAELIAFKYLRTKKIYFQKHYNRAPGKPDIALPRKKRAVFIDGDFWHGRDYERVVNVTKNPYWIEKIKINVERDHRSFKALTENGWHILRVWESDLLRKRTQPEILLQIEDFLRS